MTELEVARQIRDGVLPSPTKFGQMALFAMRVTGTGLSYRTAHEEFVWRDPSLYLNDEFLARCNGLPVIWEHPTEASSLNSEEFTTRVIGTVMLPYIRDDEVWAVARVYDDKAIDAMSEGQLSTSPAVVFKPSDGNEKVDLEDGGVMLIEGEPSYLDHLAVCEVGVWDKNGPATGVQNDTLTTGAADMPPEKKEDAAADAVKRDSDIEKMDERLSAMDAKFDAVMDAVMSDRKDRKDAARRDGARKDKFGKRKDGESFKDYKDRHDAEEKAMCDALRKDSDDKEEDCMDAAKDARRDAEEDEKRSDKDFDKWAKEEEDEPEHKEDKAKKDAEEKAEKDRKDAEEKEKEEVKEDAKKDSALAKENAEMRLRLEGLEAMMKGIKRETPREDVDALAAAQSRADAVAAMFGDRASPPIAGESPLDYRKRLVNRFKRHSAKFKDTRLDNHDEATLGAVEDIIYMDAMANARTPGDVTPGVLVPYVERDRAGRELTRYHGDVGAWLAPFVPSEAQMVKIIRPQRGH